MMEKEAKVCQFHVSLRGIKPLIWRRFFIAEDCTFQELHYAISGSMGWSGVQRHEFKVKNPITDKIQTIIQATEESGNDLLCTLGFEYSDKIQETDVKLNKYFNINKDRTKILYIYNFNESWQHDVKLEKIWPASKILDYPKCFDGGRACPPEGCGSISGYEKLVHILENHKAPDYQEKVKWVEELCGKPFKPEEFDPKEVNMQPCVIM